MPYATKSTPEADIAARRGYVSSTDSPEIVSPEMAGFCQGGVSIVIAACVPGGYPVPGVAYACRMLAGGRMRLLVDRAASAPVLDALARAPRIAVTFSRPATHRSIQVKGMDAAIVAPGDEDRIAASVQAGLFRQELIDVGDGEAFATAYCTFDPDALVAVDLTPVSAFVQTPGPGAGTAL